MNILSKWKDKVAHYVDVRLSLMRLNIIERASTVVSYLILTFIALFISLAVLIFLGIGLGEAFADLVDSRAGGYFITAGIYALLAAVVFMARQNIVNAFAGIFIRIMTEPNEHDAEEEKQTSREKIDVD